MIASDCGQPMPHLLGDANLRGSQSLSSEGRSSGAGTAELWDANLKRESASEFSLWKLFLEFEARRDKLISDSQYIRENCGKVEEIVRSLGMRFSDLDEMPPSELSKRTDLPPEVVDFFLRVDKVLADEQDLHIVWASLKRRGCEIISGLAAFLCLDGLLPSRHKTD